MLSYNEFSITNSFFKNQPEPIHKSSIEDLHITQFIDEFIKGKKPFNLIVEEFNQSINEGILGRVVGGLTGLALGKAIGGFLVRVFQLQPGTVLYKILTSSLFYMAVGAAIGKDRQDKPVIG
jgi:hypothetical protein